MNMKCKDCSRKFCIFRDMLLDKCWHEYVDEHVSKQVSESMINEIMKQIEPKTTFKEIADRIVALQAKKNESYGNAFEQSCNKYGIVSALTRLNDKMNRLDALHKTSEDAVFGESFTDTLTDLAAYAIMTIEWIENGQSSRMESAGAGSQASAE